MGKVNQISKSITSLLEIDASQKMRFNMEEFLSFFSFKQKDYILNKADKRVTFFYGGRRAGKSTANSAIFVFTDKVIYPERRGKLIYASQTIEKAKDYCWSRLHKFNKELKLGWSFQNKNSKIITQSNEIVMRGLKDFASAEKDRGDAIKLLIIDEPQTIKEAILKYYIENVIDWGMRDFGEYGRICFTGNPPHYINNYLKSEMDNPENHYTSVNMYDNPFFTKEQNDEYIDEIRKKRGFEKGKEDDSFRREVYGERIDNNNLIVFTPTEHNFFETLPEYETYQKVMGIDIGWNDADAISVLYYSNRTGKVYLVDEFIKPKQGIDQLFRVAERMYREHNIQDCPIPFDSAGLGKKIINDYFIKGGVLPLIPADKKNKMDYIEILRSNINTKNFMFKKGSVLAEETKQIIYNYNKEKIDDKKGYHSDILDATLYAFRYIYNNIIPDKQIKQDDFGDTRIKEILRKRQRKIQDKYIEDLDKLDYNY